MRRTAARLLLVASTLTLTNALSLRAEELNDEVDLLDQTALPSAIDTHGSRPKADASVLPPAATSLPEDLAPLTAPPPLALPDKPSQVKVRELRPLTLEQAERDPIDARATVNRQMLNDPRNVVGKTEELRLLRDEMRRDLAAQIVRRLSHSVAN